MIVCSCNRVREAELRAVAYRGHETVDCAYRALGCAVQCGSCVDYAETIIEEVRAQVREPRANAA